MKDDRKRRLEAKIAFMFCLYFWVQQPFNGCGNSSWIQMKWSRLPDKVLKYTSRLRWLISPKSVFLYCWFRRCRLISSRHCVRLLNLISHVFATSDRMKESPSVWEVPLKRSWISLLRKDGSCFWACVIPNVSQELLGISALLKLIFFFFFPIATNLFMAIYVF